MKYPNAAGQQQNNKQKRNVSVEARHAELRSANSHWSARPFGVSPQRMRALRQRADYSGLCELSDDDTVPLMLDRGAQQDRQTRTTAAATTTASKDAWPALPTPLKTWRHSAKTKRHFKTPWDAWDFHRRERQAKVDALQAQYDAYDTNADGIVTTGESDADANFTHVRTQLQVAKVELQMHADLEPKRPMITKVDDKTEKKPPAATTAGGSVKKTEQSQDMVLAAMSCLADANCVGLRASNKRPDHYVRTTSVTGAHFVKRSVAAKKGQTHSRTFGRTCRCKRTRR